jgi:hypothetical protein
MTGRPSQATRLYAVSRHGASAPVSTLVPTANTSIGARRDHVSDGVLVESAAGDDVGALQSGAVEQATGGHGQRAKVAAVEADPDAPIGRQPAQHLDRPADPPLGVVGVDQQGDRARGDAGERRERAGLVGLGTIRPMIESSRGVELGPPKTAESARTSTLPSAVGAGSKAPSARVEGTAARHRLRLRRVSPSVVRCSPRAASTRQSNLTAEVAGVGGRRSLSAGRSEPNNRRVRGGRDALCGSRRGG